MGTALVSCGKISGHTAIWLENDHLRVTVLPEKGADIYEFIHKPTGVDFLYKTLSGLSPPGARPPADIIENYGGGWQELFPNTGEACSYQGIALPVHGEVALRAWDYAIMPSHDQAIVRLTVQTRLLPFRLERQMRLAAGRPILEIEETATNVSDRALKFVWGHHIVLGGTFLEGGCRYNVPAHTVVIPAEPTPVGRTRLAVGQRGPWPMARASASDDLVDLRFIPGPEAGSHDVVFLIDLERGEAEVVNRRKGLKFRLAWDIEVFGCVAMWQPFGGLDMPPWAGSYGVGVEPWTTCSNLEQAAGAGKALELEAGRSLTTVLQAAAIELARSDSPP